MSSRLPSQCHTVIFVRRGNNTVLPGSGNTKVGAGWKGASLCGVSITGLLVEAAHA